MTCSDSVFVLAISRQIQTHKVAASEQVASTGSSPENLLSLLAALGRLLAREGFKGDVRDGVAAAAEALAQPGPD